MSLLLEFAFPLVMALLLWTSGILKIFTVDETIRAIDDFQVPKFVPRRITATALPFVEILLGLGFAVMGGPLLALVAGSAAVIFGVFTYYMIRAVQQKRDVTCNCFGKSQDVPVGGAAISRNICLILISAVIAISAQSTEGAVAFISQFSQTDFAWLVLLLLSHSAVFLVLRSRRTRKIEVEEPKSEASLATASQGTQVQQELVVPRGELRTFEDQVVTLAELPHRRAQLLVFAQYGCPDCSLLLAELPLWTRNLSPAVDIRIVTSAPRTEFQRHYPDLALEALYDGSFMVGSLLGMTGVPSAILLGTNGTIGAGPAHGAEGCKSLFEAVYQVVQGVTDHSGVTN